MEGNRFLDPGTPEPEYRSDSSNTTITSLSAATLEGNPYDEKITVEEETKTSDNNDNETSNDGNLLRRMSRQDHAFRLVDSVTHADQRRRPSRAGILSNLLKLDTFENNRNGTSNNKSRPGLSRFRYNSSFNTSATAPTTAAPPPTATTSGSNGAPTTGNGSQPPRPTYQLKSIASSRVLLQTFGGTQSARSSLYLDELHKAELGLNANNDVEIAAHRMAIASEIADILQRQDLIVKIGKMLVRTGAPSHRIEAAMDKVGHRLEIDGSYAVLPGLIIVCFGDVETHTSETHLIRCSKSLDIGKLERVNIIARRIASGELELEEANAALDAIKNEPPTWGMIPTLIAYAVASAFVAPLFFNGSWTDCWVSAIFGLVVGALTFVSEKIPMFGNIFEMAITIPIAVITLAIYPYVCFAAVAMSSIVIALPGYSLTCAVMELSAKNLVSGTVHLVYAVMYVLFLAFGMGYGCSIWRLSHPGIEIDVVQSCQAGLSPYWIFLNLPLATIGLCSVYGASVNQWIPMILDSGVGYCVYYFVSKYAGASSVITPSAAAFALGLFGNIYSRVTKRLGFVPLMGGIIILVPGSLGVKGAIQLFDGSSNINGGAFVFQVLAVGLSLTLGLFLANLVVYPMGKKRSVFLGF